MLFEQISLTPQDILDKEFKIDTRGFRPQEVFGCNYYRLY